MQGLDARDDNLFGPPQATNSPTHIPTNLLFRNPNLHFPPHAKRPRSKCVIQKNGNWSSQQLNHAIVDVHEGQTIRSTARDNRIHVSSLRGHVYGNATHRRRGRRRVLTDEEESEVVQYLLNMQNLGFPLTIGQLREKIGILTQGKVTPFTDGVPAQVG